MFIISNLQVRNSIFTIFNPERPKKSSLVDTLIGRCRPVWKAVLSLPPQLVEMACGMLCSCVFCQWQSLGVGAEFSFLCDSGLGIPSLLSLWVPRGPWWGSGMGVFYRDSWGRNMKAGDGGVVAWVESVLIQLWGAGLVCVSGSHTHLQSGNPVIYSPSGKTHPGLSQGIINQESLRTGLREAKR